MQHWNKIIPLSACPPRGYCPQCACSLIDPNLLSSSRCHHLHQESADKSHTWLPCPPPDLSVAEEEVVGLDPKLLLLWGEVSGGDSYMNAWILNVATLIWKQVEDKATKKIFYSNIRVCCYLDSSTTECWSTTYLFYSRCAPSITAPSCDTDGRRV